MTITMTHFNTTPNHCNSQY